MARLIAFRTQHAITDEIDRYVHPVLARMTRDATDAFRTLTRMWRFSDEHADLFHMSTSYLNNKTYVHREMSY
jgi:hypothetical protein